MISPCNSLLLVEVDAPTFVIELQVHAGLIIFQSWALVWVPVFEAMYSLALGVHNILLLGSRLSGECSC